MIHPNNNNNKDNHFEDVSKDIISSSAYYCLRIEKRSLDQTFPCLSETTILRTKLYIDWNSTLITKYLPFQILSL